MPTFKSTQMTNYTAGPPATTLKSSEHNRVHVDYHAYTPVGTETTGDATGTTLTDTAADFGGADTVEVVLSGSENYRGSNEGNI